jgi:hypothetical protein
MMVAPSIEEAIVSEAAGDIGSWPGALSQAITFINGCVMADVLSSWIMLCYFALLFFIVMLPCIEDDCGLLMGHRGA